MTVLRGDVRLMIVVSDAKVGKTVGLLRLYG